MAKILKNGIRKGYNSEQQNSEWFKFGTTKIQNKINLNIKNSEFFTECFINNSAVRTFVIT